ncbi:MAG: hypothetical protein ACYC4Q_03900, partial [Victivallaceae bacterium]
RVTQVKVPSKKVVFADAIRTDLPSPVCFIEPSSTSIYYRIHNRHQKLSTNVAWVDGHVSNITDSMNRLVSSNGTNNSYWKPFVGTQYIKDLK